jgi:uncharacterized membrane protein YccC
MICVLIAAFWHLEDSFFAVITVLLIMGLYANHAVVKGVERFIGSIIGVALGILFSDLSFELPPIFFISLIVSLFISMYFFAENRFAYAAIQCAIMISVTMISAGELLKLDLGIPIHRVIGIAVGVIVSWLILNFVWHVRTKEDLDITLSNVFKECGNWFKSLKMFCFSPQVDVTTTLSVDTSTHLLTLITLTKNEEKNRLFAEDLYIKLVAYCNDVVLKTEFLRNTLKKGQPFLINEDISSKIKVIFDSFSERFQRLGEAMEEKRKVETVEELHQSVASLEATYANIREAKAMADWQYDDVLAFGALISTFKGIANELEKMTEVYNKIQENELYDKFVHRKLPRRRDVEERIKKEKFAIHIESVKQSVKCTLAVVLVMLVCFYFNYPGVFPAVFTALIITSQANLGQAHLKEKLRFLGCLVGAIYGFLALLILTQVPHFAVFFLVFFLGLFLASYISTGSERVAYGGIQAGFVLPIMLMVTNGPVGSLDPAVYRLISIVMGGAISLLVLRFIWPVHPLNQLREKLSFAFTQSGVIFETLVRLKGKNRKEMEDLTVKLATVLPLTTSLLKDAHYMISIKDLHTEEFLEIIESLEIIYVELTTLDENIYGDFDSSLVETFLTSLSPYNEKITNCFNDVAFMLKSQNGKSHGMDTQSLIKEIENQLAGIRQTGITHKYASDELERLSVVVGCIINILRSLDKISVPVNRIAVEKLVARPAEAL